MLYILEIGSNILPDLHKLDELYKQLKGCKTQAEFLLVTNKLEVQLEQIFGTKFEIYLDYKGELSDNFAIIPVMKKNGKLETKEDFIKLGHVRKLIFIIGYELINYAHPKGLTAITLHEIGHTAAHISQFVLQVSKIARNINEVINVFSTLPIIGNVLFPIVIITSRTLSWTEHIDEYASDRFAAKYGYGDELVKVTSVWMKKEHKLKSKLNETLKGKLFIIIHKIVRFLFGTTHPTHIDRIKKLIHSMKTEYNGKYNNKELQKILDSYTDKD